MRNENFTILVTDSHEPVSYKNERKYEIVKKSTDVPFAGPNFRVKIWYVFTVLFNESVKYGFESYCQKWKEAV